MAALMACITDRCAGGNRVPFQPGGLFGHYADFSHLEPMRRELALAVPMSGWPADDVRWAEDLRNLNIVQTEHYLDETLYYYLTRSQKPELKIPTSHATDAREMGHPLLAAEACPWIYMTKTKVKMLTGIAGNANPAYDLPEHSYQPEQIVDLHPDLAGYWIAAGIAEAHKPPSAVSRQPSAVSTQPSAKPPAAPSAAKVVPIASADGGDAGPLPAEREGAREVVSQAPGAVVKLEAATAGASSSDTSDTSQKSEKAAPKGRKSPAN